MANQNLIKGAYMGPQNAGIADLYLNSIAKKQGRGPGRYGGNIPVPYKNMQQYLNKKVDSYIDNLPAGYEVEKLPSGMRNGVTNWSKDLQIQAGNHARLMKKTKPGSPQFINARNEFQNIKNQFKNISTNLDQFKAAKTEFLQDYDSKTISEGVDTDRLKLLYSTDTYNYSLVNGQLQFQLPDGSMVDGNKLPKYFNKNSDGANKLLQLNESSYKSGGQWDSYTKSMYERKVNNIVQEKGREGLLSLATDTFLDAPIIAKDHPNSWLLQEENHEQLQQYVVDQYVQGMESAAGQGYEKKQSSSNGGSGSSKYSANISNPDQYFTSDKIMDISDELGPSSKHSISDKDDGLYELRIDRAGSKPWIQVIDMKDPKAAERSRKIYNQWLGNISSSSIDPANL
mgnify:CR=1 FL=1|jgi:hypothetical protein|tara:strand:+ start:9787 stop:10983 length:1197 start_codon:yes stop_codon:yes gene_type:complete